MYMVTRAIFVKLVENGFKFTLCLITSPVFEVQKTQAPIWKWHKNRVQLAQTIFQSNGKWRFYNFLACNCTHITEIALVTICMLQTLKTGSHFFHKTSCYLLKMFLGTITMVKVPKNADMCQILGNFAVPLVKSLSNTKRASTGS